MRGDREIVTKAVSRHAVALQFAAEELRGDREIVMKAVSSWGGALEFVTDELKSDSEIVTRAVTQNGSTLRFASKELRGDRQIVMKAVSWYGHMLRYASEELRGDAEMLAIALRATDRRWLVALKVRLLSGRFCDQIFDVRVEHLEEVPQTHSSQTLKQTHRGDSSGWVRFSRPANNSQGAIGGQKNNRHKQLFGIVPGTGGGSNCLFVAFVFGEQGTS